MTIYNLLPLDQVSSSKDLTKKEVTQNENISRLANKIVNIGKAKDGEVSRILKYDITPYSSIFDGSLMTIPDKAHLIKDIEKTSG